MRLKREELVVYTETAVCFSAFVGVKMNENECLLEKNCPTMCFGIKNIPYPAKT